jgi:hypothetical protein
MIGDIEKINSLITILTCRELEQVRKEIEARLCNQYSSL